MTPGILATGVIIDSNTQVCKNSKGNSLINGLRSIPTLKESLIFQQGLLMGILLIIMDLISLSHSLNLLHKAKSLPIFKIIKEETLFNRLKNNSKVKGCQHSIKCFLLASFQMQADRPPQFKTLTFTILQQ
jgi:hypothetical protein